MGYDLIYGSGRSKSGACTAGEQGHKVGHDQEII